MHTAARPPQPRSTSLPRGNAPAFVPPLGLKANSFRTPFVLFQQLADFRQLLFGCLARSERPDHEARRRAVESPLQQISGELPLGPLAWPAGLVDMRPLLLIAPDQSLLRHDLQQLQHGGILRRLPPANRLVDFPNRAWTAAPQHGENFQLGI